MTLDQGRTIAKKSPKALPGRKVGRVGDPSLQLAQPLGAQPLTVCPRMLGMELEAFVQFGFCPGLVSPFCFLAFFPLVQCCKCMPCTCAALVSWENMTWILSG